MVKLYVSAIQRGTMTIDSVPALWRSKVAAALSGE